MPEDTEDKNKLLSQSLETFLDTMVRVAALQLALVEAGVVSQDRLDTLTDELNQTPEIVKARTAYGVPSAALDALLRSHKGQVQ